MIEAKLSENKEREVLAESALQGTGASPRASSFWSEPADDAAGWGISLPKLTGKFLRSLHSPQLYLPSRLDLTTSIRGAALPARDGLENLRRIVLAALVLWSTTAFGPNRIGAAGKGSGDIEGRLTIRRLEISVTRSVPPEVFVRIHGVVLNGCTDVGAVQQHRNGRTITVTIPTYSRNRTCTMVARLIDETIQLEGDFTSGSYVLDVDGVVKEFHV